jgi:hypothetical protein
VYPHTVRDRAYIETRLVEEMERGWRYGRSFTLLVLCKEPESGKPAPERLVPVLTMLAPLVRATDVIATVDDCTIAALLVECDPPSAEVAIRRFEAGLARLPKWEPDWELTVLQYPADCSKIETLPFYVPPDTPGAASDEKAAA